MMKINEKEYLWYKLCVFYHAKTEIFDRGLTNLRSQYDPTEAYVDGRTRNRSIAYARDMRQFVYGVAKKFGIINRNFNEFNYYHYSAQSWIDEFYRLKDIGEMEFIDKNIS